MKKSFISFIALLGLLLAPLSPAFADYGAPGTYDGQEYTTGYRYVTDTAQCFANYGTGGSFDCAPNNVMTAYTGSNDACRVSGAAAPASGEITTVLTDSVAGGGYYFDCIGSDASATPDNWVCIQDTANTANHIGTQCTGLGTSVPAPVTQGSDTNCLPNYTNCDGDLTDCEIQEYVTAYPDKANAVYTPTCSAQCDASHLSCTGTTTNGADDADGCEITEGVTAASEPNTLYGTSCTARVCDATHFLLQGDTITSDGCLGVLAESCTVTATALPGTCTAAGTTGTLTSNGAETCACSELAIPEFATGGYVDADGGYTQAAAEFNTSDPLLWGKQTGTGGFIDFSDGTETKFSVDKTGKITTGFIGQADLTGGVANANKILGINASGEPVWTTTGELSGSGDSLGNHTATETLKMGSNKIVSGLTDTNGIAIADSTGDVTLDGNLTVHGTGASAVDGSLTIGTGATVTAGGVGITAGDLTLTAGNIVLSTGGATVDGVDLTTLASNVSTNTGVIATKLTEITTCASGEVMRWNTTGAVWECANPAVITAQTLEDAYDTGTNAATRTIAVDADAIKFDGQVGATGNIFELANAAAGDAFVLTNTGAGNAMVVNTDEFVIDTNGNTIVKQLRLVASVADNTTGLPTSVTCAVGNVGDMTYSVKLDGTAGNYFGCKETTDGVFTWVSMEVFGV